MAEYKKTPRLDLNPSSSDRWMTCTASPKFIFDNWDKLPPRDDKYNTEGTTAHEVASALLQDREPRENDPYHCPAPITPEMRSHAWDYMEYVQGLREPGSTLIVEKKFPLFYAEGRNAIVDAAILNPGNLHIVDYKYGAGVVVSPENSLQASIYAKCVETAVVGNEGQARLMRADLGEVTIHIYQPRGRAASESPFHVWQTSWSEINEISERILATASFIKLQSPLGTNGLEFKPSEKACQFCPAKGFCPERHKRLTDHIQTLQVIPDGDKHLPPVKAVSLAELAAIVKNGAAIKKWIDDANAYALQWAKLGNKLPGLKLVTSRGGNRFWTDEKAVARVLLKNTILTEENIWEKKLIGPATVEELLGKPEMAKLANLIGKPQGKPVLASEDDKRESCDVDATKEFEVITG